ncbi:hypothetical protein SEVIR_7G304266v4 [Setaria viridis]|uniref:Uncharacterized protein n=1 Tax=Setaria viridis TaxID=4556 RepID=A0A4V6Y846_SETVI|nr:hypothetical protein SEVIR_7G304266v2 [Setaria viridis]
MGLGAVDGGASPSWGGRLAAEGCTSTGATMSVAHRAAPAAAAGGGHRCCGCGGGHCVNIYVNNNVQGVTNSVLLGSKVVMRDPGARVTSRRRPRRGRRCKVKTNGIGIVSVVLLCVAAAAAATLFLNLFVRQEQGM